MLYFSIAVDDKNKQVVAMEITDETIHDNAKFGELAEQSIENVENKGRKVIQINAGLTSFLYFPTLLLRPPSFHHQQPFPQWIVSFPFIIISSS